MSKRTTTKAQKLSPRKALDRLPPGVKVGPFDYRFVRWSADSADADRKWGHCDHGAHEIGLAPGMPDSRLVAYVVLHEIMHAVCNTYKRDERDREERTVVVLSTGMTQVYRDNPWLSKWMQECLT